MSDAVEKPETVGMSGRRLELVRPVMQSYVDRGVYSGISTLIARRVGAMGQWHGRAACAVRDLLMRTAPRSVQLRQLDLVLGLPADRDLATPH